MKRLAILAGCLYLAGCATNTITSPEGEVMKFTNKSYAEYLRAQVLKQYGREAISSYERMQTMRMQTVDCPLPRLDGVSSDVATLAVFANMACQSRMDYSELAQVVSAASGNPLDPAAQMYVEEQRTKQTQVNADARTKAAWIGLLGGVIPAALYTWKDVELSKNAIPGNAIIMGDGSTFAIKASNSGTQSSEGNMAIAEGGGVPGGAQDQVRQMGISVFGDSSTSYGWATDNARLATGARGPNLTNDVSGTMSAVSDESTIADTLVTDSNIEAPGAQAPALNQNAPPVQILPVANGN